MHVMSRLRFDPGFPVKGHEQRSEHVERRDHCRDRSTGPEYRTALECEEENLVLAEEAGKGKDSCNGKGANEVRSMRIRQLPSQGPHLPHVQFAGHRVHHASCREEEQTFEKCMGHEVEYARPKGPYAARQEHVSQLADRRIRKNPFDVELSHAHGGSKQSGCSANHGHDRQRNRCHSKEKAAPSHHVHAGCHHRGSVDQGADRRRTFHGVREPRVKRNLR